MTGKSLGAEPAFPFQEWGQTGTPASQAQPGVNKRELFAAMAMQGLISDFRTQERICNTETRYTGDNFASVIAVNAVEFSDALLDELAKGEQ